MRDRDHATRPYDIRFSVADSTGVPLLRTDFVKVERLGTATPEADGMMESE